MSENLPIIWDDKVNSPELLAYFQQFGKNTYVSAEELNQIRDAINELSFPNGFIKTSPLTRVDNEISIDPFDFKWILNKIIIENEDSYSTTINAAVDGYHRKDIIVANASGGFDKVEGDEDVDIALMPDIPDNTLLVSEIDIFGASVIGSTSPVVSSYVEKGEFAEATMTGDSYMQFSIPQYSSIRFIGDSTIFKGVYLFPGYKAYSGKKLILKNFQTTDITLKHLSTDPFINTPLYFPNHTDYILKQGKIIEFSISMITNRFEFIGDSEDISGKEDVSNKGVADGYAPLNSAVKIASEYLEIVNDLVTGGNTSLASAETVKTLKTQINAINTLLTSDNINLDTVQEIVDAIETVQISLSTILVNDLTTGGTTKALTAEMGKSLKVLIDDLATFVAGKENSSNKTGTVIGNEASTSLFLHIAGMIAYFEKKLGVVSSGNISGTFVIDHSNRFYNTKTLTATTTFTDSNLIVDGIARGMYLTGNHSCIFPAYWIPDLDSDLYDGTKMNRITWDILNSAIGTEVIRYTIKILT